MRPAEMFGWLRDITASVSVSGCGSTVAAASKTELAALPASCFPESTFSLFPPEVSDSDFNVGLPSTRQEVGTRVWQTSTQTSSRQSATRVWEPSVAANDAKRLIL